MHHQAHVVLVDPHTEGIGGADHLQLASDEGVLDAAFLGHLEPGMETLGAPALGLEMAGQFLHPAPTRGIDHGRALLAQMFLEQGVEPRELLLATGEQDVELQVRALLPTLEQTQRDPEFLLEVLADLLDHLGLGGRREAGDRRHRHALALGQLADEARGVEIVGPEVMTPLGEAVRLVEHPGADLAALEHLAEGCVAQLFGRDVEDGDVTQTHPLQHVAALGRGQHAVDGGSAGGAGLGGEVVDLVLHQRLQRRDDQG